MSLAERAPRGTYAITAAVGLLVLIAATVSFVLQLVTAMLTWPLLLCSSGRLRFHTIQSRIWRTTLPILCVGLNPFWRQKTHFVGSAAGPPDIIPGSVIFVNHRSNSDPFVVSWLLLLSCIEAKFIYKSSLSKLPVLGWNCVLAGDLAVHHGDKQSIVKMLDKAREVLRQGYHVLVFPEGTRSPSGLLQDFKPTFFQICEELGCPAVPVCVLGTERAWPHGGFRMGCATVHMAMGEPVMPGQGGADALSDQVARQMQEMAREVLMDREADENAAEDPFVSGKPYAYWRPPKEIEDLLPEDQMKLLKAGKGHERGAHLA
uniref:Phospholipid/glycerol acyltransferase domain-containing protein n=1 Tax=Alexandrium catenella TaxID=2925 RepID=A0A7S1SCT0_ALECA|mmetsp:Transcript_9514/g.25826  ORF Transcript_9514/g.25826 Transcript_9514/m.25826 type:complete len:318 (+) Transcript_9514:51-1004(+)|eukprot:CAMPEP_0171186072 /NCGR_PEP_ID=MMETSP0790-20130122/16623_1 /TAXON_ID=2925 /ORGANISM="Alexandrium catenella, Strain OF101" /LENGTH=317 /DNA_ID=CAMNT_0011651103 /DNA_START=48 /DNA_END=1001 /DNA_ORIENTATION=+